MYQPQVIFSHARHEHKMAPAEYVSGANKMEGEKRRGSGKLSETEGGEGGGSLYTVCEGAMA